MKSFKIGFSAIPVIVALVAVSSASADEKNREVVARGLNNPCGIAIQPTTGDLFVSDVDHVFRLVPAKKSGAPMRRRPEVADFPTSSYGKGPKYAIGPLGLAFLNMKTLVVGGGGLPDGEEIVRFYEVGKKAPKKPIPASEMWRHAGPIEAGEQSVRGEGNFYALAISDAPSIFVTCNGDDTKGWISKIDVEDGMPGELEPFIASKPKTNVDAPTGATISPDGDLVVTQIGEISVPGDALLTIYDPKTGKLKKKMETGLNDPIAVAYSPKTGKLYAVDFSWIDLSKGGLFELVVKGDSVKAKKIARLDKPTAMTFDDEGNLFVTILGKTEAEPKKSKKGKTIYPGAVVKFCGL